MKTQETKTQKIKDSDISLKVTPDFKNDEVPIQLTMTSSYMGPLPPPDFFERYNKALPGAANRILTLAEDEAKHRRNIERTALTHNLWLAHLGQACAFIIGLTGLLGAIYCASIGQQWAASLIATGGLAALIAPFLKNWKSEKKN